MAVDQHGNHIINICLSRFPPSEINFIVDVFANNCREIASHKHGCMVMQKCLLKCSDIQRERLTTHLVEVSLSLSQDQFGNYIIQNIIKMNNFEQNQSMLKAFTPHLVTLCSQKFSSNVIEKVHLKL
jgi:pumilio RNA-binding family